MGACKRSARLTRGSAFHRCQCARCQSSARRSPSLSWGCENRLPGSDTNPYLTVAATLAAGLSGIAGKIEPAEPVTGNSYGQVPESLAFAQSMLEAISALRNSAFARNWFGERFVTSFAATRQPQLDYFARKITDIELQRVFDLG